MKSAIYTLIFFISYCTFSYSQTSLEGKVFDAATGESILFGTVALYKNDVLVLGVETDLDGNFFFSDIDPGTYDVEASYIGYIPQRQVSVIVKAGRTNRLDFSLSEGVLIDAVEIVEYKMPSIEWDKTASKATITREAIRSLPSKRMGDIKTSPAGIASSPMSEVRIRGTRSDAAVYYIDGVKTSGLSGSTNIPLPKSGQMTAGEWNDLHNWKDWLSLLEEENYRIMMDRFDIHPTNRFSVLVINDENSVLANELVQLLDQEEEVIWSSYTDNSGRAELWENALTQNQSAAYIKVGREIRSDINKIEDGSNTFVQNKSCFSPDKMDIVFTVDATSSMNDEINYLKSELLNVITRTKDTNKAIDFKLGSVFYRDTKDEYLTRVSPLSSDIDQTLGFIKNQNSNGGGDMPEAVDAALEETLNLSWRTDALKIVFLILDAPPHEDDKTMLQIRAQIKEAAQKGIKLIPITASGIGRETEFLMKFMAILTNGTYVFITDDSGIGNPHLDPVVEDYEVEKLNDCLVRLISQFSKPYSCEATDQETELIVSVYPNPATQYVNVKTNEVPDAIKIYSANGMMVKSISPTDKETRIEMVDFVNGIYTIRIQLGDKMSSKQIILLK